MRRWMTTAPSPSHVAHVDFSPVLACSPGSLASPTFAAQQTINEIGLACSTTGFVFLSNCGRLQGLGTEVLNLSKLYFAQSLEVKQQCLTPNGQRGYYRYVSAALDKDSIEAFNVGHPTHPTTSQREAYFTKRYGPDSEHVWRSLVGADQNRWPTLDALTEGANFQSLLTEYYMLCQHTSELVLECLAIYMGLPHKRFRQLHKRADHNLEVKYYPTLSSAGLSTNMVSPDAETRLPVHTDLSSVKLA